MSGRRAAVAVVDRSAGRTDGMAFDEWFVRSRIFRWQLQSLLTYIRE